jgi:hypothetical protein
MGSLAIQPPSGVTRNLTEVSFMILYWKNTKLFKMNLMKKNEFPGFHISPQQQATKPIPAIT